VQARGQGGKTFLQLNVTATSFYSNQERGLGLPQGLFGGFRSSPGIAFAVGRWVTPAVGLRLKMNGFGCKTVVGNDADGNSSRYLAVFGDVLLNVSSLILGDDGNRCWDVSPYVGGGINRNFTYDEYGIGLRLGVQGCWHFDRRWGVNLDIGYSVYEPDTDGIDPHDGQDPPHAWQPRQDFRHRARHHLQAGQVVGSYHTWKRRSGSISDDVSRTAFLRWSVAFVARKFGGLRINSYLCHPI